MAPEQSSELQPCQHCDEPIREGEKGVNWPWIHNNGWYQCLLAATNKTGLEYGVKAEPKAVVYYEPPKLFCTQYTVDRLRAVAPTRLDFDAWVEECVIIVEPLE